MAAPEQTARDRRSPIERLLLPFEIFAAHKLAGAFLLIGATVVALAWANSPWHPVYERLLGTKLTLGLGSHALSKPLQLWINDGLMALFFFVVGLEIKREILDGELSSPRKAALPIVAAAGGMAVPALLYLAFNRAGPGTTGWGIPMATDIAFALGVLALLGDRVPTSLKVFLTALAIVDDIGAILVIALFYTDSIALGSLAVAALFFALSVAGNLAGLRNPVVYFLLGTVVWVATLKSGIHATLAAVLMALTIPARSRIEGDAFLGRADHLLDEMRRLGLPQDRRLLAPEQHHLLFELGLVLDRATAPLRRLEHALAPLVTFLVLPVFALANAGVTLDAKAFGAALGHPVFWGILAGLFVGKQIGIVLFSWIAVRLGLAGLPSGVGWRALHGVAVLGGVGFTMSLFIGSLAFSDPALQNVAKTGILAASLLSAVVGWLLVRLSPPRP